jgi:hypothetical protein
VVILRVILADWGQQSRQNCSTRDKPGLSRVRRGA